MRMLLRYVFCIVSVGLITSISFFIAWYNFPRMGEEEGEPHQRTYNNQDGTVTVITTYMPGASTAGYIWAVIWIIGTPVAAYFILGKRILGKSYDDEMRTFPPLISLIGAVLLAVTIIVVFCRQGWDSLFRF